MVTKRIAKPEKKEKRPKSKAKKKVITAVKTRDKDESSTLKKQFKAILSDDARFMLFEVFAGWVNTRSELKRYKGKHVAASIDLWIDAGVISIEKTGRTEAYTVNIEPLLDCFCEAISKPAIANYGFLRVTSEGLNDKILLRLCKLEKSRQWSELEKMVCKNPQFRDLVKSFLEGTIPQLTQPTKCPAIEKHPGSLFDIAERFVDDVGSFLSKDARTFRKAAHQMQHAKDEDLRDYAWILVLLKYAHDYTYNPFKLSPKLKTILKKKLSAQS